MTGGLTSHYKLIKNIFEIAKKANMNIIKIGGGGGFSSEPLLFTDMTNADIAVIGEGESTIVDLIDALENKKDLSYVNGIVYKDVKGEYVKNPMRVDIKNLDSIPFPDYDDLGLEEYLKNQSTYDNYYNYTHDFPRMYNIYLGRSCPYNCNFCYHPLGNRYRQRSLDNFFLELDMVCRKYKINSLGIFDELFSMKRELVLEFCKRIKPYNLSWHIQFRVNLVDEELLRIMREAGCASISYGIESYNDKVLKNMNKKITKEQIDRALRLTYESGILIQGNLIFGDEEETIDSVEETLNWWREHRKYHLNLWHIETYPGTALYNNSVKKGLIKNPREFIEKDCPIINMTQLSNVEFDKIKTIVQIEEMIKEKELFGEIISIERSNNEKFVEATFRCNRCGNITKYKTIQARRIYSNNFKIACRHCGVKNVYDTRKYMGITEPTTKYRIYFELLKQWARENVSLSDRLRNFKENEVAVLYSEDLGKLFVNEIMNELPNSILVDDNKKLRYDDRFTNKIISYDEFIKNIKSFDIIIVMDAYNYYDIKNAVYQKDYRKSVLSFSDILLGINLNN